MNLDTAHLPDSGWAPHTVAALRRETVHVQKPADALRETAFVATLQQLIDDLPEQIALLDERCNILAANTAWKQTVEEHGYLEVRPGGNYRDFCATKASEGYEPAIEAVAALDDIVSGKRSFWELFYNGRERWKGRDYQICVRRIWVEGRSIISVTRFDLTEITELRRARDDFATT